MIHLFACTATLWINLTLEPWNSHDKKIHERATWVCGNDKRYWDTPCVKTFTKTDVRTYQVICGATTEKHGDIRF